MAWSITDDALSPEHCIYNGEEIGDRPIFLQDADDVVLRKQGEDETSDMIDKTFFGKSTFLTLYEFPIKLQFKNV